MSDTPNQRLDERYPAELVVSLHWNRQCVRLLTSDVSYRGLFIRTDTPPVLRQLVRLEIELAPGELLSMHGMAVHVVKPGDRLRRDPGVGVQFYAIDRDAGLRWRRFVDQVQRTAERVIQPAPALTPRPSASGATPPPTPAQALRPRLVPTPISPVGAPPPPPAPTRRSFPRYDAELELDLRSESELYSLLTRDVSRGGMFIVTDAPLAPGAEVLLQVRHPARDEHFDLSAVVRRRGTNPSGLGVEFTDLTHERREAFMAFIQPGLPTEEVLLVQAGDPELA
ncbi:MAG: PilZ domain-containing protein [Polyangiales bacterium]